MTIARRGLRPSGSTVAEHERWTIVQCFGLSGVRVDEGVAGALLRHAIDPQARRLDEEADVLRASERRLYEHGLVARVWLSRGDGVGVDLIRQAVKRRQIENLDMADDVRRLHQLPDGQS